MAREIRGSDTAVMTGKSAAPDLDDQAFVNLVSASGRPIERIMVEIAPTNIPVLIVGECGSGKEVIARRLHRLSRRGNEPFVKLTCARLSIKDLDHLLAGKKTACIVRRLAEAGTVFLDEISDLELPCQPKLLHMLADCEGGSHDPPSFGARIISSSSQNIEQEIRNGRFREDLYYRLNGVCLGRPPLDIGRKISPSLSISFCPSMRNSLGGQSRFLVRKPWADSLTTLGRETSDNWKMR